ncbi:MAG TPA: hypothetical protein VM600_00410, partial [Actinomycetota bacterium]|nr:hypothetical protein [Actinomycetota bacterium]
MDGTMMRGSAGELIVDITQGLDAATVPYVILRNYEGYPEVVTGDVDFLVAGDQADAMRDQIRKSAAVLGWRAVRYLNRPYGYSVTLYREGTDRPYLVIDVFIDACWYVFPYI